MLTTMNFLTIISILALAVLPVLAQEDPNAQNGTDAGIEPNPSRKVALPLFPYQPVIYMLGTEAVRPDVSPRGQVDADACAGARGPDPKDRSCLSHRSAVRRRSDAFR